VSVLVELLEERPPKACLPSQRTGLRPMVVVPLEGPSERRVCMLVPTSSPTAPTVLWFNDRDSFTWSGPEHLDNEFLFVRYLSDDESITITGA